MRTIKLATPPAHTGLGLGDGAVSLLALVGFVALVAYLAVTRCDVQRPALASRRPALRPQLSET